MEDQRQYPRKAIQGDVPVTDINTGRVIGRLVNLSANGMMLHVDQRIAPSSVFQFRFSLQEEGDGSDDISLGVENLWCNMGERQDTFWAGFHVIDIADEDRERLIQFTV